MATRFRGQWRGPRRDRPNPFKPYRNGLSEDVRRGVLIQGAVRVNPWNHEESYVPHSDGESDIVLCGMANRNRALNGDIVAVQVHPRGEWNVHKDNLESYVAEVAGGTSSTSQERGLRTGVENLSVSEGRGGTGRAPTSKYTTLNDMLKSGNCSPLAQRLLSEVRPKDIALSKNVLQRTGTVVGIIEKKHPRVCVGHLERMRDNNPNRALFFPTDRRVPRLMIAMDECPQGFQQNAGAYETILYMANIREWPDSSYYANGKLGSRIGFSGEIEAETKVIMIENNVDNSEFSKQALSSVDHWLPWKIPQDETEKRKYLSNLCIFTIDGESTLDLDDAISCRPLGNGLYEVGVHIADVTYFVPENSALDKEAAGRGTCVHFVNKRAPMLPRLLREDVCSLNPGVPRLAFSVIWTISDTGKISEERFDRTIVSSCCKFTYGHAQAVIGEPDKAWKKEEFPPITNDFTVNDIKQAVLSLDKIAKSLRQVRFANGALNCSRVGLRDALDPESGLPTGFSASEPTDGNDLIEEFSLLANMAVAKIIKDAFPKNALLHRHPCPQPRMLTAMENLCKAIGISMDTSSSGAINNSLVKFSESGLFSDGRKQVLIGMIAKCFQRAQYFCTANHPDETFYHHYSLNVPIYTHFTSPIRSYPDIMVHRILSAALEKYAAPSMSSVEMQRCADHCNDKISASRRACDLGYELYLAKFIMDARGIEEDAIVSSVKDRSFEITILRFGVSKRVPCDKVSLEVISFSEENDVPILTVKASGNIHKITIFTKVKAALETIPKSLRWNVKAITFY